MKITNPARPPERRKHDVLARLERERDIWVATADGSGLPCLVPLRFVRDGEAVWLSTRITRPTGRSLRDGGRTRLVLGDTRDVVLPDGDSEHTGRGPARRGGARLRLGRGAGAGGRGAAGAVGPGPAWGRPVVRLSPDPPCAVQAWREEHEPRGRHLMRDGVWAV